MTDSKVVLDIVMNSSFDKDAGGRETWLYNFLPEILKDPQFKRLNLFGCKTPDQGDFSKALLQLDPSPEQKKRLSVVIFEKEKTRFPQAYRMFKAFKQHKDIENPNADYVLAVGVFEMLMVYRLKRYKNAKKIIWLRSIFSHEKAYAIPGMFRKLFLNYELKQLKKADVVLGNGDDIKNFYEPYGVTVEVIKNGVAMDKWKMPAPKLDRALHIAYVGRLSKVKGVEDYLRLIRKVKRAESKDQFVFHIVGENGIYKDEVAQLVSEGLAINHNSIPNDQLPKFLENVDVCVALTYASSEGGGGGTSNAMMEQMAAGRIMLAWDNRIFRQYLNESNAYLAEQYNVAELEEKLYCIANEPQKALVMAQKGIETIYPYSYVLNVTNFKKAVGLL